ncbi:GtrA family protein [Breoghania sp.]|uniref:GtrA family protein n=1 Tax=Breoghania sp. TaxID=2065378 RepID=UPI002AA7901B|nr:GtrA family protein [Breoghania sp.]
MQLATFIRFLISGGVAAAANIGARVLFSQFVSYSVAIVAAYVVGLVTGYTLMKCLVFDSGGRGSVAEYGRYFMVNMAALGQVWLLSVAFKDHVFPAVGFSFHAETVAHAIGVLSPMVTSYFLHKKYTFGARRRAQPR